MPAARDDRGLAVRLPRNIALEAGLHNRASGFYGSLENTQAGRCCPNSLNTST